MAASAAKASGSPSKVAASIVFVLLTLMSAGLGLATGSMLQPADTRDATLPPPADGAAAHQPEDEAPAPQKHAAAGEGSPGEAAPELPEAEDIHVSAVPFPPVLTTLAEPKGTWIRIEGSMLINTEAEDAPELLAEQAATHVLAYLRTVTLTQIEGPSGLAYFRQDLNELVAALSDGQVREVLIHSLVVE